MGVDFLHKTKNTFQKGWDRESEKLREKNLLTETPAEVRTVLVQPVNGNAFNEDDLYELQVEQDKLVAYRDQQIMGISDDPPKSVVEEIVGRGGKALGKLDRVRELSGRVDIAVILEP